MLCKGESKQDRKVENKNKNTDMIKIRSQIVLLHSRRRRFSSNEEGHFVKRNLVLAHPFAASYDLSLKNKILKKAEPNKLQNNIPEREFHPSTSHPVSRCHVQFFLRQQ